MTFHAQRLFLLCVALTACSHSSGPSDAGCSSTTPKQLYENYCGGGTLPGFCFVETPSGF